MSGDREPVIQRDISVPEEAGGPGLQLTQGGDARLWPRGAPEELEEVEGRTEERRAQPCSLQDGDTRQETFICQPGKQPDGWSTSAPSSPRGSEVLPTTTRSAQEVCQRVPDDGDEVQGGQTAGDSPAVRPEAGQSGSQQQTRQSAATPPPLPGIQQWPIPETSSLVLSVPNIGHR